MKKGYRLQVLGYSFLFVLLLTVTCTLSTIYAADSSPSAEIKAKLEELKREIASKAAKLKLEVDRKLQNRAYAGKIKSISNQSITVATRSGPKIISINQDTTLSRTKIKEEDYIAGLGDVDETGVLLAKKIILLTPIPYTLYPKTYLWGQVISISDQLATLKDKDYKNIPVTLPDSPEVKLNNFIILTGKFNKNKIFESDFAYVIPQGGILKPKKVATPSANLN